jgi:uncharacterized protein with NRDE domain
MSMWSGLTTEGKIAAVVVVVLMLWTVGVLL